MFSPRFPIHVRMTAFIGMFFLPVLILAALDSAEAEPNSIEKIEVQILVTSVMPTPYKSVDYFAPMLNQKT
ncbi:hypothetical protein CMK17_11710 [Candidatus Poribacteria bacterium]|nr:hypothetical protein [Candidatus Poribacteria bacterium]